MSMNNSNQQNLCKQGCGFYGTAQNMDMCSKCYQDFLKTSNNERSPMSQHSNPISINEVFLQSKSSITHNHRSQPESDSNLYNLSENRKRSAQSESETVVKVPKISENEIIITPNVDFTTSDTPELPKIPVENSKESNESISPGNSQGGNSKKPRRCQFCRRKVGLTGFDCRCGGHFCAMHRYSDKHSCTFDYQAHGQEQIKNQNPMIVGSKIKKI